MNLSENVTFTYLSTYGNFGWRDGGDDNSYEHSMVLVASSPTTCSTSPRAT